VLDWLGDAVAVESAGLEGSEAVGLGAAVEEEVEGATAELEGTGTGVPEPAGWSGAQPAASTPRVTNPAVRTILTAAVRCPGLFINFILIRWPPPGSQEAAGTRPATSRATLTDGSANS